MMNTLDTINPYDWDTAAPHFAALQQQPLTPADVPAWLLRWSDLSKVLQEGFAEAYRAKDENTTDKAAEERYLHFVQEIQPKVDIAAQALKEKLLAVEDYVPLPEHREMLRRLRAEAALFREANVPLEAHITARANDYFKITGAMTVTIASEELTIQQAEQRLLDPNRANRETAWRAVADRWQQDHDALNALFLELLPLRRQVAANADMPDYRAYKWQELKRFDYTPQDALQLHAAIEAEWVPVARELHAYRRMQLGLDTLRPWDMRADPHGQPPLNPFATIDELEEGIGRIFTAINADLGDQWLRLRDGFLDLGSRKGKAPGGYQFFFPRSRMPYIFWNAVGTNLDLRVLLHEGGHAFHALAADAVQPLIWNISAPMEFNEVASMSMELLGLPYLEADRGGFYTLEDAQRARFEQLEGVAYLLCSIAQTDAFQHWIYTEAPAHVSAANLAAKWTELQQRFQPDIDWTGIESARASFWHRTLHIFVVPFYMIEYALAQLGALQIWRHSLTDQATALQRYRVALALGGTASLRELYQTAGATPAFDRATVGELAAFVREQLDLNLPR